MISEGRGEEAAGAAAPVKGKGLSNGQVAQLAVVKLLRKLLSEERGEMIPELGELADLRSEMGERTAQRTAKRIDNFSGQITQGLRKLRGHISERLQNLTKRLDEVTADSEARSGAVSQEFENLREELQTVRGATQETFRQSIAELKTTIDSETRQISEEFRGLETAFCDKLDAISASLAGAGGSGDAGSGAAGSGAAGRESMGGLEKRVDALAELVGQIPLALEAVEGRIDKLAADLRSDGVGTAIDTVRARVETAQTEVTELLDQAVSRETATNAVRDELHGSLDEVRTLLREGMRRREMKKALVRRRLLDLRDVLQENLSLAEDRQDEGKPSLWKKVAGVQTDPKLTAHELERIRGVLEEVLRTVEYLVFENNQNDGIA